MEPLPPPPDIAPADWEQTPPAVRQLIGTLLAQVADLTARLGQHSGNSSRPPSSDPPSAPKRSARPPRGRRRGAQPGHPGHARPVVPPEQVDAVVEHPALACPHCHTPLAADLPPVGAPRVQQVWELPPLRPTITEHRFPIVTCPQCARLVTAPPPPEVPPGAFGPHLTAFVALLHGRYRLSARECAALLGDVFGVPLALGTVPALCQQVNAALAAPYTEAATFVQGQAVANVDETGWKQAGRRCWLWVMVTALVTLFRVDAHRSSAALQTLLGADFHGVVGSDRYSAYEVLALERRQLCWAHLKRDVQAFAERDGPVGKWGQQGMAHLKEVFTLWHAFRQGHLTRAALQAELAPVQAAIRGWLEEGLALEVPAAAQWSRAVRARDPALWTFAYVDGVEPTNNTAERALRPAVLWRKGCFGAASPAGNEFVARMMTVIATCRQQKRHLWTFLGEALQAYWAEDPAPSLIPTP